MNLPRPETARHTLPPSFAHLFHGSLRCLLPSRHSTSLYLPPAAPLSPPPLPLSPSFQAFDELLLLKRGGETIFFGQMGHEQVHLVGHFESIPNVHK